MKRFLIIALVGALSMAGGTGLAFGADAGPQPGSKPQSTKASPAPAPGKRPPSTPQPHAKKPTPPPPKKDPPSKPPTQANKPPSHRDVKVDVPKGAPEAPCQEGSGQAWKRFEARRRHLLLGRLPAGYGQGCQGGARW
jgi:hypothetical protein